VRVFKLNGKKWKQLGQDTDGETTGDNSGNSISLLSDGRTIAIGAPLNDENANNRYEERGHVQIFSLDGNDEWVQVGKDIDGKNKEDEMGRCVSISSDGSTVAVGAG